MDFYINNDNVLERLKNEYKKYGNLIIAYDFDNTIYDYHNEGHEYNDIIEILKKCKKLGFYLIIFTCCEENKYDFIINYCNKNDIPFDPINENAPFTKFSGRKIYYNLLLDDRAGLESSYNCLNNLIKSIDF